MRLIAATKNKGKVTELRAILGELGYDVVTFAEAGFTDQGDVEETADSFEGNARQKALGWQQRCGGAAVIADDSGLEVDALGGAPGVYSARYCGRHGDDEANNDLLLENLKDVPAPRTGRYVAAIALVRPGCAPIVRRGTCGGEILFERRGTGGFGYDPLFQCETGETFAEVSMETKNAISHRKRGITAVLEALKEEQA